MPPGPPLCENRPDYGKFRVVIVKWHCIMQSYYLRVIACMYMILKIINEVNNFNHDPSPLELNNFTLC